MGTPSNRGSSNQYLGLVENLHEALKSNRNGKLRKSRGDNQPIERWRRGLFRLQPRECATCLPPAPHHLASGGIPGCLGSLQRTPGQVRGMQFGIEIIPPSSKISSASHLFLLLFGRRFHFLELVTSLTSPVHQSSKMAFGTLFTLPVSYNSLLLSRCLD